MENGHEQRKISSLFYQGRKLILFLRDTDTDFWKETIKIGISSSLMLKKLKHFLPDNLSSGHVNEVYFNLPNPQSN